MADGKNKNKSKKVTITEEDVVSLLERYPPMTIITLLQEVGQVDDVKFDWNELVKKTKTGITSAREYQMVWKHLAYQDTLSDGMGDELESLDDDSDLETELEAYPPLSAESSAEAVACAKVILGSGLPSDTDSLSRSTVEAPLTVHIPRKGSMEGKNIIVPVRVPRLPLPAVTSTEGLEGSGPATGGLPARRKRKPWTEEEDMELIAAVQKCGERNWANILKGDFKGDRTASQLSQRWAIIRKRQANMSSGAAGNSANPQLTEAQLATRRAVSHALNMPMMDNFVAACSGATPSSIPSNSAAVPSGPEDTSAGSQTQQSLHHKGMSNTTSMFRKDHHTSAQLSVPSSSAAVPSGVEDTSLGSQSQQLPQYKGTSNTPSKSRVTTVTATKGPSIPFKSFSGPNPTLEATAVAAGARIATPSTAASLLKAAQSKNVVHIRPGGGSLIKTPMTSVAKPSSISHLRSHPNVHYIRTGLTPGSAQPTYTGPSPSIPRSGSLQQEHTSSTRPQMGTGSLPLNVTSSTLPTKPMMTGSSASATLCGFDKGKKTNAIPPVDTGLLSKEEVNSVEKKEGGGSLNVPNESDHAPVGFPKPVALTVNQAMVVENLKQPQNVAGENKPLHVSGKESEISNIIKEVSCSTAMDED